MNHRIVLEKEAFKFSVAHFTILSPEKAERLHGHNYYVTVELVLKAYEADLGMAFDFNDIKPLVKEIADRLDEYVLLPERSPYVRIEKKEDSVRATFGTKSYEFPKEDVLLLPIVNVSSEELARYVAEELAKSLGKKPKALAKIKDLAVGIQETRGQGVYHHISVG